MKIKQTNVCKHFRVSYIINVAIWCVAFCGCETWSLILRKELRLRMSENGVLRRIFGPKRDEVTKKWRKLHNEKLNGMYSSPNIVRVIKSTRTRWTGRVSRMGRGEAYTGFWWGNMRERDHLGDPRVDGRIILRWIFRK